MILLVACTVIINTSFRKVILAEERITEFKQSGPGLVNASTYWTAEARKYVQFGGKFYFDNYWREVNETKSSKNKSILKDVKQGVRPLVWGAAILSMINAFKRRGYKLKWSSWETRVYSYHFYFCQSHIIIL